MSTNTPDVVSVGDVAAALDAAERHAQVLDDLDLDRLVVARRSDRVIETVDLERFNPRPLRQRGTVVAHTVEGFVLAHGHRAAEPANAAIYADLAGRRLVAVLNDDTDGVPGWRDDRIEFTPRTTPEWDHWHGHQGLGTQARFAEAIEAGETEIVEPSATVMLEIAQTFEATVGGRFKQHGRLSDGRMQFSWEEEADAKAQTSDGHINIPDRFFIELRPFWGAKPRRVMCRIRYRLKTGELTIGYTLVRPDDVLRDAFLEDVLGHVREQLPTVPLIEGIPAGPQRPDR